ncbi:MAG: hypothetical protein ACFFD4_16405 [Candidatus Odinarchaeota archaeon]
MVESTVSNSFSGDDTFSRFLADSGDFLDDFKLYILFLLKHQL